MKKFFLLLSVLLIFFATTSLTTFAQDTVREPTQPIDAAAPTATPTPADAPPQPASGTNPTAPQIPSPSTIYNDTNGVFDIGKRTRYTLTGIVNTLLPGVATWIAGFLAALGVIFLIYAGILFLTAGGEEDKITEATKTAVYVVVGLFLTMFAYALVYLFLTLFSPSG